MTIYLESIGKLKTQAKNRRDRNDYPRADSTIREAIKIAQQSLSATDLPEWRSQVASELVDCFGLLGGIQRRWAMETSLSPQERAEHLRESIHAYDEGYLIESDRSLGLVNSYNMLNRLLSRLFYDPETLTGSGRTELQDGLESVDLRSELQRVAERIRAQIASSRRGDYWALADLALVNLLLEQQNATSAYAAFNAESPPDFAYESALSVLKPLAELSLSAALVSELQLSVDHLEQRLAKLREQ